MGAGLERRRPRAAVPERRSHAPASARDAAPRRAGRAIASSRLPTAGAPFRDERPQLCVPCVEHRSRCVIGKRWSGAGGALRGAMQQQLRELLLILVSACRWPWASPGWAATPGAPRAGPDRADDRARGRSRPSAWATACRCEPGERDGPAGHGLQRDAGPPRRVVRSDAAVHRPTSRTSCGRR